MAGIRRKSEDMPVLNQAEIIAKIREIPNTRDKALASFLYLTGCRISEVLGTIKTIKTYHKEKINGEMYRVLDKVEEVEIPPLTKESVEIIPLADIMLVHQVPCLKRVGKVPRRTIPIILTKNEELVNFFQDWHDELPSQAPLFNIKDRRTAWKIINKHLGMYTHFLIHERCTHLVTYQNFTDLDLKQFRGWSSTAMAGTYTHLKWQDIAKKMRR